MINNKKAFSSLEIILVLFLTGVIVSLGVGVIKTTQSNYRHLYYAAYTNLQHSAGELIAESATKTLPLALTPPQTFCQTLADNYNISNDANSCIFTYDFSPSKTFSSTLPNVNNPSFTLSNGQRYYVGNAFKPAGADNYFNAPAIMIAVDLNGTAGPNVFDSITYAGGVVTPDIVAFAILEGGTVLPMSPMADRADYISANVQTCSAATGCPSDVTQGIIYNRVPIRQALSVANAFPPRSVGPLAVQYNTDTTYSFKTTYAVDTAVCTTQPATFCKILVNNPLIGGIGMDL